MMMILSKDEFRERMLRKLALKKKRRKQGVTAATQHIACNYYKTASYSYKARRSSQNPN